MTRINLIPPEELHDRHLVAEYRELPRIFALIRADDGRRAAGVRTPEPPPNYVLGPGHVRFFYDKAHWLLSRQRLLIAEMRRRGMRPNFTADDDLLTGIDDDRQVRDWAPSPAEVAMNRGRIEERLRAMGVIG